MMSLCALNAMLWKGVGSPSTEYHHFPSFHMDLTPCGPKAVSELCSEVTQEEDSVAKVKAGNSSATSILQSQLARLRKNS